MKTRPSVSTAKCGFSGLENEKVFVKEITRGHREQTENQLLRPDWKEVTLFYVVLLR